jgi:hypothetical protein
MYFEMLNRKELSHLKQLIFVRYYENQIFFDGTINCTAIYGRCPGIRFSGRQQGGY